MTDDNAATEDGKPSYAHQMKLRDLAYARALDEERTASDVIKITVSNLFILNAGGIAAIPGISTFFIRENISGFDLAETFLLPGMAYILGEILALFCAFIAYIHHLFVGGFLRAACESELASFDVASPAYEHRQNVVDIVFFQSGRTPKYYRLMIIISFWAAVFCGLFSLLSFIAGSVFLTGAVHGVRGL